MGKNRTCFLVKFAEKRTMFNWLFFILVGVLGKGGYLNILAGTPFILAGEFIRTHSAGTIKKNEVLTDTGLYGMCRNPLYLGSFLISAGLVIVSKNIFIFLYFLVFFPLAYIPAILTEEAFLTDKFGEEYLSYRKRVPVFIPAMKRVKIRDFSWKQVLNNKEHLNWIVILALLIISSIKSYLVFNK
ncbi:MAG: isoprenylcysteine carboxylmethyltransferase family protein [Candidatus Omnitrophica bacterium]|nr:isoprenylcysteine carboxylmethyltransferase family protein [Candidatus Omnitrophota bacterium]